MVVQLDKKNYEAWFDYGDTLFELGYLKEALHRDQPAVRGGVLYPRKGTLRNEENARRR